MKADMKTKIVKASAVLLGGLGVMLILWLSGWPWVRTTSGGTAALTWGKANEGRELTAAASTGGSTRSIKTNSNSLSGAIRWKAAAFDRAAAMRRAGLWKGRLAVVEANNRKMCYSAVSQPMASPRQC